MYKKSDLKLVDGMLVHDGEIVQPDPAIVDLANELETSLQKAAFVAAQPSATPMPSLEGFERVHEDDDVVSEFEAKTPVTDAKVKEAMAIMDEADDVEAAELANAALTYYAELIKFVKADYVVAVDAARITKFDTPALGSILDLTVDGIKAAVAMTCGLTKVKAKAKTEAEDAE
jgi:hypothetical protein